MPASKEFRKATLDMLRKMVDDPKIKIERKISHIQVLSGMKVVRYAFIKGNKTLWSIRKGSDASTHPIDIAIDGKTLWGEFLDSEVESLYKDVEKEFKKRNPDVFEKTKKAKDETSLGAETENKLMRFLKQHIK